MHHNHKIDEKMLKEIITSNVKTIDKDDRLNVIFYYKNLKTSNLVMKNNLTKNPSPLCRTNVIYEFVCPMPHCKAEKYIGMTQTTVSRRLTYHGQSGSIHNHFTSTHNCEPTRDILVNNTNIIASAENRYKLAIKEALLIRERNPTINKQYDNFVNILKLNTHRNFSTTTPTFFSTDTKNPPEIPDLGTILQKFGINFEDLKEVPLSKYNWNKFDNYLDTEVDNPLDDCFISQRIKSLDRKTRNSHYTYK